MAIRMSGLVSNMDTDSIIKELMKAQSMKKVKIENKITRNEWSQEKWKALNTKIYALYTGSLNKLKSQNSFLTKKVSSSDESKVTVTATAGAVEGTHNVKVLQTANAQYLTGTSIPDYLDDYGNTTAVSGKSKLVSALNMQVGSTINLSSGLNGEKSVAFDVTEYSTVDDFIAACKDAGINATLDTAQKKMYLSSSSSGVENAYQITTSISSATPSKDAVRELVGYESLGTAARRQADAALETLVSSTATADQKRAAEDKINSLAMDKTTRDYTEKLKNGFSDGSLASSADPLDIAAQSELQDAADAATQKYNDSLEPGEAADPDKLSEAVDKAVAAAAKKYADTVKRDFADGATGTNPYFQMATDLGTKISNYETDSASASVSNTNGAGLDKLGLGEITFTWNSSSETLTYSNPSGATLVEAADSKIEYNGALVTGSTNTITANGLTFTVIAADPTKTISLTVSKDTQAVYDTIKTFVKEYNELLKEMNEVYDAKSARGYEPLTDEEREAMTDDQIEKWESKIKDSLLRRDNIVSGVLSSMKNSMAQSVEYDGKAYALSSFGISSTDYKEKGILHIFGDSDDSTVSDKTNKLMKALKEDPEAVMSVFTGVAQGLYTDLADKMKSTTLSSAFTVYNDKKMSKDLETYKSDLKEMEKKLQALEDRYYKQFTAMETAMSKLNSQSNSLASMLGTGGK